MLYFRTAVLDSIFGATTEVPGPDDFLSKNLLGPEESVAAVV